MPQSSTGIDEVLTINGTQVRVIAACDTKRGTLFANYYTAFEGTQVYGLADGQVVVQPIPASVDCASTDSLRAFAIESYPNRTGA